MLECRLLLDQAVEYFGMNVTIDCGMFESSTTMIFSINIVCYIIIKTISSDKK